MGVALQGVALILFEIRGAREALIAVVEAVLVFDRLLHLGDALLPGRVARRGRGLLRLLLLRAFRRVGEHIRSLERLAQRLVERDARESRARLGLEQHLLLLATGEAPLCDLLGRRPAHGHPARVAPESADAALAASLLAHEPVTFGEEAQPGGPPLTVVAEQLEEAADGAAVARRALAALDAQRPSFADAKATAVAHRERQELVDLQQLGGQRLAAGHERGLGILRQRPEEGLAAHVAIAVVVIGGERRLERRPEASEELVRIATKEGRNLRRSERRRIHCERVSAKGWA